VAALQPEVTDYVCIGGVFATASKNNPDPPVGIEGFARLAERSRARAPVIPVGAIAGINERNAAAVIAAGADGIAIVSAVTSAADPEAAARNLRTIIEAARAGKAA
jgi:thiamine-phosphate pyrophosphorylase